MNQQTESFIKESLLSYFPSKQKQVCYLHLRFDFDLKTKTIPNNYDRYDAFIECTSKQLINQLKVDHKLGSLYFSLESHRKNMSTKKATYILLSPLLELVITLTTDCGSFYILPLLISINFFIYWILFYSSNEIAS